MKFSDLFQKRTREDPSKPAPSEPPMTEYQRYCEKLEQTLSAVEAQYHTSDDPEEIGMGVLKAACEFYRADWSGIMEIDMDLNIWTPFWWYNVNPLDRTTMLLEEYESSEFLHRWVTAMRQNKALVVRDAKQIKEDWPEEYAVYQRLHASSLIGIPIKPRPVAFLIVRNPKCYLEHTSMLKFLGVVTLNAVNDQKMVDRGKNILSPVSIRSDQDVLINLFGNLEICTNKGILREQDFKAPKCCRVIVYLLLNRRSTHPPQEIATALWPNGTSDVDALCSNIRGLIYRIRQKFSKTSSYPLIESTPNGYRLNPELNIVTDLQQFDRLWESVQNATATIRKVDLLKQTAGLYRGPVFESACDEHWIVNVANRYSLHYTGVINELMAKLADAGDYFDIHQYATRSLEIEPGNIKVRYWLIFAMCRLGSVEMAKSEIERSKELLTTEEYDALIRLLKLGKETIEGGLVQKA